MNRAVKGIGVMAGVLAGQAAWARWRPLPTYSDLDPNGTEGPTDGTPLRLLVLGDSSCTGAGLDDPADIWVRVLARMLGDHGYRVGVASFAVGGSKAADVLRDQVGPAVAHGGDVALVSVGGNDALRGVGTRSFERTLDNAVAQLTASIPLVALSGVGDIGTVPRLPHAVATAARRRAKSLNAAHGRVARRHGALVADQWAWAAARFRDPGVYAPDLFHPNAEGHQVWAAVGFELLAPVLTRSPEHQGSIRAIPDDRRPPDLSV
ncbi:MAG TPA: SGNH/GDSL hydrolase family protein [Acidimicrobiia bacterium]|nr:SGNH/GDSL hydrolase family protein [Acidimicrobiia bacterium]